MEVGFDVDDYAVDYASYSFSDDRVGNDTERKVNQLYVRTVANKEWDIKGNVTVEWGDPKGPKFEIGAEGNFRGNNGGYAGAEIKQRSDGTGRFAASGGVKSDDQGNEKR